LEFVDPLLQKRNKIQLIIIKLKQIIDFLTFLNLTLNLLMHINLILGENTK